MFASEMKDIFSSIPMLRNRIVDSGETDNEESPPKSGSLRGVRSESEASSLLSSDSRTVKGSSGQPKHSIASEHAFGLMIRFISQCLVPAGWNKNISVIALQCL